MSQEMIAVLMFSSLMLMLFTGQRVFGAIGGIATIAALLLWGTGGSNLPFAAAMKVMKWYPHAYPAHVHFHGLRVVREQDRG